jgi:carboxymethylenebutenolidase
MGETVEFASNGAQASGYLARAKGGGGPGVLVLQEWWGLVPQIKGVCDRLSNEGFTALAPDLYHGDTASEPDEAGKLMMAMNVDQAARDMGGAVDKVAEVAGSDRVGVTGFCMGGGLALVVAAKRPDKVKAVVPWYGLIPWPDAEPDYSRLDAKVLGHYAGNDEYFSPDKVAELQDTLDGLGKEARLHVVPGAEHAFFNDDRPEVHDPAASQACFRETVDFLRAELG